MSNIIQQAPIIASCVHEAAVNVLGNDSVKGIDMEYLISIIHDNGFFCDLDDDRLTLLVCLVNEAGVASKDSHSLAKKLVTETRVRWMKRKEEDLDLSSSDDSSTETDEIPEHRLQMSSVNYEPCFKEFMLETWSNDPRIRKAALRDICPCRIKKNVDQFWRRIMEMADDENDEVRYQVLHNLCDGSPRSMEEEVIALLEKLHNDKSKKVRRQVHRVLTSYRKTGKWNIL